MSRLFSVDLLCQHGATIKQKMQKTVYSKIFIYHTHISNLIIELKKMIVSKEVEVEVVAVDYLVTHQCKNFKSQRM